MDITRYQQTLAGPAVVTGIGYWSGQDVRLEFRPAPVDTGIVFVREDLEGRPRIPVHASNRVELPRQTSLQRNSGRVDMVEHVLAALAGLGIDNCEIGTDAAEMPGCDGSALTFVRALDHAGLMRQETPRFDRLIREVIRVGDGNSWVEARPPHPFAKHVSTYCYQLDYGPESPIGRQSFEIALLPTSFRRELACCRTFLLESEAKQLAAQGLGRRATPRDLLVFNDRGPIDNHVHFADECARHKVVDLMGDLVLAGCPLIGRFHAYRSGHRLNAELVQAILERSALVQLRKRCA